MNVPRAIAAWRRHVRVAAIAAALAGAGIGLLLARDRTLATASAPLVAGGPAGVALRALADPTQPGPEAKAPLKISVLTVRLARDQTLGHLLSRLSLAPGQAQAILAALKDKFPFRRARPGDQITVERVEGEQAFRRFTYRQSAAEEWTVVPEEGGALRSEKRAVTLSTQQTRVDVEIHGSVWETLQRADEDPALAAMAADVLAWDVDFYQDVRAGDHLKLVVEKVYADGKLLRYGEILGAEYSGWATGRKRLFRYTDAAGRTSYYDDVGRSARRGLLKSPLKYAAVSSGFGSRMHPILGYVKAHQGVDYRAPTGTPVWSVGDGTVSKAGWNGACGKSVAVRYSSGVEAIYCHLSTVTVRAGEHVSQKQVVGLVGQTGRATGPHLHYAVKRNAAFINPLNLKVPPEAPLAPKDRADFDVKIAPVRAAIDGAPVA